MKRSFFLCGLGLILISCSGSSSIVAPIEIPPEYNPPIQGNSTTCSDYSGDLTNVIWMDDFNNEDYSMNWTSIQGNGHEYGIPGWGNNEQQFYTDLENNVFIDKGCMKITPLNQDFNGYSYTSAKMVTENKVDFNHPGRITVRFRSPIGTGMWPAIWMMPLESIYGGWPASGEIDLVEIRGNNMQELLSTIHYGSDPSNHKYQGGSYYLPQEDNLNEKFHTLTFIWQEDQMEFILDNQFEVFSITKSQLGFNENYPFNEIFYLIINVAVGGNFVGNYVNSQDLCFNSNIDSCNDSQRFLIDWVIYESL